MPGTNTPNISIIHLMEAYYWTIILVTRPYLSEAVTNHIESHKAARAMSVDPPSHCRSVAVDACVHSAIKIVDLLQMLPGHKNLPRRLPIIVNSLLNAALVLSFAFFGDFDEVFPVKLHLDLAHSLLKQFHDDSTAKNHATRIGLLKQACEAHVEDRPMARMHNYERSVNSIFGKVSFGRNSGPQSRAMSPRPAAPAVHGKASGYESTQGTSFDAADAELDENIDFDYINRVLDGLQTYMLPMSPRTLNSEPITNNSPFFLAPL